MPTSAWHYVSPILQRVAELHAERPIRRVLDVGVGGGKWGMLTRELLDYYHNVAYFKPDWKTRIEGIEVFEQYRTPVHDYIYDQIHWGDATKIVEQLVGGGRVRHHHRDGGHRAPRQRARPSASRPARASRLACRHSQLSPRG